MSKLLWLFLIPFLSALCVVLSSFFKKNLKLLAVSLSFIPFFFLIANHSTWIGSEARYAWAPSLSISWDLRIDSLVLLFLYLTAVIVPIALIATRSSDLRAPALFYRLVLILQGLLFGFFMSHDLAMFTLLWEAMLIPLYFILNVWGGAQRHAAALKFILYMVAGSALMVAAVLALYVHAHTFDMETLKSSASQAPYASWIFAIFLLAFAVKTPLFPFHAWLPDAYCQAPLPGTLLLSAILSKAGIFGIVRITMEFFPQLLILWSPWLLGLAIAGVLYAGLAAWKQNDYKRLIAYSSLSHVNFVLAGLFVWNPTAHEGAILQALNHSITITALFLAAGWLEERLGTLSMNHVSGLAKHFPSLCWFTLFFVLASIALPGLNNFIGEFLVLLGVFSEYPKASACLALTVILSALYMLRWMQKVYFEEPIDLGISRPDMKPQDYILALSLTALIVWIGLYPQSVLEYIQLAAQKIHGDITT